MSTRAVSAAVAICSGSIARNSAAHADERALALAQTLAPTPDFTKTKCGPETIGRLVLLDDVELQLTRSMISGHIGKRLGDVAPESGTS